MKLNIDRVIKQKTECNWAPNKNLYRLVFQAGGRQWIAVRELYGLTEFDATSEVKKWKDAHIEVHTWGVNHPRMMLVSADGYTEFPIEPVVKPKLIDAEKIANRLLGDITNRISYPPLREYVAWLCSNPFEQRPLDEFAEDDDPDATPEKAMFGFTFQWWMDQATGNWHKTDPNELKLSEHQRQINVDIDTAAFHLSHELRRWRDEGRNKRNREREVHTEIKGLGSTLFISISSLAAACGDFTQNITHACMRVLEEEDN